MPYSNKDFSDTNINYINKDFRSLKNTLIEYAKTYFPNTYKDFNETSPGMMLIEMAAYVGDVQSFYIDQQYREMMLPLAEERKNVINIAKMLGYRTKPIIPAYVDITVKQTVDVISGNTPLPDYSQAVIIDKGMRITSTIDSDIIFETLDVVDFTTSGSADIAPEDTATDENNLTSEYTLTRQIRAISGETKTKTFIVESPSKFLTLTLPETNVIEIINVVDSNNNKWYEVDYLAQDKVPIETHFTDDSDRSTAYSKIQSDTTTISVSAPYTLEFIKTNKRFIIDVNENDTTSLIFGNGVMRSGQTQESLFLQTRQIGINIPGSNQNLVASLDPLLGDEYSLLGEAPAHTTLTVTYRIGGGINSNVPVGDLTTINVISSLNNKSTSNVTVTNDNPARGGSNQETVNEIRHRASAFFTTQNRCVTKQDYEIRCMNMSAKFGNIAKVYVAKSNLFSTLKTKIDLAYNNVIQNSIEDGFIPVENLTTYNNILQDILMDIKDGELPTIDIYTLSYNNTKELVETPTDPIGINLKNYLSQFRLLTDSISLKAGYVINFGIIFDVFAHKHANKQDVKLRCIQKIIDYFNVDKMQFRQPIHISQLEYELMSVDGVRSVNYVCITQGPNWKVSPTIAAAFDPPLWLKIWDPIGGTNQQGSWTETGTAGYGYYFDFESAHDSGIIKPPITPAIFELKNPKANNSDKHR